MGILGTPVFLNWPLATLNVPPPQGSYYPLYPPSEEVSVDYEQLEKHGGIQRWVGLLAWFRVRIRSRKRIEYWII